ncbi:hypothetical protein HYW53_00075 [Candidatus Giovannonibacteria bacterium]|nr:hypothetical protein [Candidatus Giovannonibacteria bacterium]
MLALKQKINFFLNGLIAFATILAVYFSLVSFISGIQFAINQFLLFWPYLISLAIGFGIQISLYSYLKKVVRLQSEKISKTTIAVTGTTSTIAMISCCAHYLANLIPIIGIAGAFTVITQYQIELFWVGLAFNMFGIILISYKIIRFRGHL